jgi:hypothetical protein
MYKIDVGVTKLMPPDEIRRFDSNDHVLESTSQDVKSNDLVLYI